MRSPDTIPSAVHSLERDLRGVFGDRLRSLVLYDLHAPETAPTRTMAVVDELGEPELHACAAHVKAWHDKGLATPLLVVAAEFDRSLDVFPLEFGAILADHLLVAGTNPFKGLEVEPADLRRACELQTRSHLLHLREGYLETRGAKHALAALIVQSAAPLAALLASVARLDGKADHDHVAAGRHAERLLAVPAGAITDVVKLVHVAEIPWAEAERLFPPYLDALERLVRYVDRWSAA
jgi:hypothetical protein